MLHHCGASLSKQHNVLIYVMAQCADLCHGTQTMNSNRVCDGVLQLESSSLRASLSSMQLPFTFSTKLKHKCMWTFNLCNVVRQARSMQSRSLRPAPKINATSLQLFGAVTYLTLALVPMPVIAVLGLGTRQCVITLTQKSKR